MHKFYRCVFLFCSFVLSVRAQPLTRIYNFINAGDYETAKSHLDKLEKHDAAIDFAWARYYFESDNPNHQVDSAKLFVVRSAQSIADITKKSTVKRYNKLGVRAHYINDLNQRINTDAFNKALSLNIVSEWNHFLEKYSDAVQFSDARVKRNALAFMLARESNNPILLQEFFTDYPDANEAAEARSMYDQLLYMQQTGDSTWRAYKHFMEENPNSPYFSKAKANYERLLYHDLTKTGTADAYANFINTQSDSPYRPRAEDSLYARYTKPIAIVSKLNQFIQQYSSNKNVGNAWNKLYLLTTNGSDSSILLFLNQYPNFPFRQNALVDTSNNHKLLIKYSDNEFVGFKDSLNNQIIIPATFWDVGDFSDGLVAGTKDNCDSSNCKYGYYDISGRQRIAPKFSEANPFHQGYAIAGVGYCSDSCLYGLINKVGDFVVPPIYYDLSSFSNGLALVRRDTLYGYIDQSGRQIIPLKYSDANEFSEGLASVYDTSWKFIDTKGQVVINGNFSQATSFSEGLSAAADEKDLWGYIDKNGNWIIKPQFTDAAPFVNGKAIVNTPASKKGNGTKPDKERWIDKQGKFIKVDR